MTYIKVLFFALFVSFTRQAFSAIDCKPGMGNCPETGYPSNPHPPAAPTAYLAIGYAEIPSPDCTPEDRASARKLAVANSVKEAKNALATEHIVEQPGSFFNESCHQGFYAGSTPGLSWIVQYFAHYKKGSQN